MYCPWVFGSKGGDGCGGSGGLGVVGVQGVVRVYGVVESREWLGGGLWCGISADFDELSCIKMVCNMF